MASSKYCCGVTTALWGYCHLSPTDWVWYIKARVQVGSEQTHISYRHVHEQTPPSLLLYCMYLVNQTGNCQWESPVYIGGQRASVTLFHLWRAGAGPVLMLAIDQSNVRQGVPYKTKTDSFKDKNKTCPGWLRLKLLRTSDPSFLHPLLYIFVIPQLFPALLFLYLLFFTTVSAVMWTCLELQDHDQSRISVWWAA